MATSETALMPSVIWTVEREQKVRSMWDEGCSGQEISDTLGASISRSAVLGKVHRMRLPGRMVEVRASLRRHRNRQRQAVNSGAVGIINIGVRT